MKRLNNLQLDLIPTEDCNRIRKVNIGKYSPFLYLPTQNYFENLFLKKYEVANLPYLDIYTVHALSNKGITVGYCFDVAVQEPKYDSTYLIAAPKKFKYFDMDNFDYKIMPLKLKIKTCNIYTLDGLATMVTVGSGNTRLREVLEI